ncbi:hypothetical protein ACSBR1_026194 [Camellia fascicularis]
MYNHFGTERRAQVVNGDAESDLAYLCGKEEQDPMLYYKYSVDEENRLNNLFWTDGGYRTNYLCFGDVLMFDITYRTNADSKPFKNLVDKYGLHNNKWIADVYCKRTLWAKAYLHGHFFAGAKSTQRCESMNAFLNRFLKVHLRLFEFVRAYDRALARLRHNEAKAQSKTENTTPILSIGMKRIERHAADIVMQTTQFRALSSACTEICYYVSHLTDGYEEARDVVTKLTCRMKKLYVQHVEGNGIKRKKQC